MINWQRVWVLGLAIQAAYCVLIGNILAAVWVAVSMLTFVIYSEIVRRQTATLVELLHTAKRLWAVLNHLKKEQGL